MIILGLYTNTSIDPIGIMIITTPLFFPIAASLGFDLVWFGILFVINMEMAFLTPPFGFNRSTSRAWRPRRSPCSTSIVMIFPATVLWLPHLLLR